MAVVTGVRVTTLDSEPSELGEYLDPTMFFDEQSSSSLPGWTAPATRESCCVSSSTQTDESLTEKNANYACESADLKHSAKRYRPAQPPRPPEGILESEEDGGLLPPATSLISVWARSYTRLIAEYRARMSSARSDEFTFIFAIPLRKIDSSLNKQWPDCFLLSDRCDKPIELPKLLTDPYNFDLLFAGTLPETLRGASFSLAPADLSDKDGPYIMPTAEEAPTAVSLRDGHVFQTDAVLDCGIELEVSGIDGRETKCLAYWDEVSGQWAHVPLSAAERVCLHQKRCVANIFDIYKGRITSDRVIKQAGVYSAWS